MSHWQQQKERSTPFAFALLVAIARWCGRPVARLILVPTALYFLLTNVPARDASRQFLTRSLGRPATWRDLWRHFFTFAAVTLDRVLVLVGAKRVVELHSHGLEEAVTRARGRGCLVLVAHLGSFEAIRQPALTTYQLPLRIVLDREQGRMFTSLLEKLDPAFAAGIIDASARGPDLVLRMKEALDDGSLVGLMADRAHAGERTAPVSFLGRPARLPAAPWIVAGTLGVPVLLVFCVYRGGRRYDAHFEWFAERVELPRGGRDAALAQHAQRYAERLEHHARSAPYNWFNFYDFWAA